MRTNTTLGSYNFRYNGIYDEGCVFAFFYNFYKAGRKFLEVVKEYKHIFRMKLTEHISKEVGEGFKNALKRENQRKRKRKEKKAARRKKSDS